MQVQEILQQLDTLLKNSCLQEADVFLKEQIAAAEQAEDWETALTLYNEQIGFFEIADGFRNRLQLEKKPWNVWESCI